MPHGLDIPSKSKEEMEELVELFALVVDSMVNKSEVLSEPVSLFQGETIPSISIKAYLSRYVEFLFLDEVALIVMLIYLDRYIRKNPEHLITSFSIHRLIASILQVAHKVYFDENGDLRHPYAEIAGLSGKDMNELEVTLLFALRFDLFVGPKTYLEYKENLVAWAREQMRIQNRAKPYPISITEDDLAMQRPVENNSQDLLPVNPPTPITQNYMESEEQAVNSALILSKNSVAATKESENKMPVSDDSSSSYNPRFLSPTVNASKSPQAKCKTKMSCQIL
ncbi:cyclin family putative virulence effector [Legionella drancourtii]|uniref:Cyclin n=1 Tax=Legionella drancourtii LLAP12 TaxID=658187 RepID=G9EKK0_9GAMM|nr:cyclin family putative virulence effector [Legionella drancourtii]EHL32351.1 hypothetical protein LDG_5735 [Legionella drancourtii LLAP12]